MSDREHNYNTKRQQLKKAMGGLKNYGDRLRNTVPNLGSMIGRNFKQLAESRNSGLIEEEEIETPIIIGKPKGMNHVTHMTKDDNNEWGIAGLPEDWIKILVESGIKPEKVKNNQAEAMQALAVVAKKNQREAERERIKKMPLLSKKQLEEKMKKTTSIDKKQPSKFYKKMDKIGEGAGGIVFRVKHLSSGEIRAVKISPIEELEFIKNEIAYHAFSTHENIVTYHETFSHGDDVWIVMDLVRGGSLTDILGEDNPLEWTEVHIAYTMNESLKGLDFMHKGHLLHRDIKSDNILVDRDGSVKLADFGFAVSLTQEKPRTKSTVGTPFWMAPEVIQGVEYDERCDIWSLGITALELVNHNPPHMDKSQVEALVDILTKEAPKPNNIDFWSDSFLDFLDKSLQKDFNKRFTAEKLLGHGFLKKECTKQAFADFVVYNLDNRPESDDEDEYSD
eukprot:augustus_masked-scaffold_67-processed-gene-0.20-mRNA-1 protein AED:0.07 eAED:0.07 QI:0/-1/0/1/-1/1/1/0/449